MHTARTLADDLADDALIGKVALRTACSFLYMGDYQSSERYALDAARIAERIGDWGTYTDAQSMLCASMCFNHNDPPQALWHAQQLALGATRSGDRQKRSYGLWAQYDIEVNRGRRDKVEALEVQLKDDPHCYRDASFGRIAQAMRLGWDGRFIEAIRKIEPLEGTIPNGPEQRYWRATLAMFHAFAGHDDEAKKHLTLCGRRTPSQCLPDRLHHDMADVYVALANVFIGRNTVALRYLSGEFVREQERVLAQVVRLFASLSALTAGASTDAIALLRESGRAGLADVIGAALGARVDDVLPASLTSAEVAVLRALAAGQTPKQISVLTDRSYETIRYQMKSVYRKLGVSSQIEATAAARRFGIV